MRKLLLVGVRDDVDRRPHGSALSPRAVTRRGPPALV